jgi:hypothetical protein
MPKTKLAAVTFSSMAATIASSKLRFSKTWLATNCWAVGNASLRRARSVDDFARTRCCCAISSAWALERRRNASSAARAWPALRSSYGASRLRFSRTAHRAIISESWSREVSSHCVFSGADQSTCRGSGLGTKKFAVIDGSKALFLLSALMRLMSSLNLTGVTYELATAPTAPALVTAAASSGVDGPPAIGAWMSGALHFRSSHRCCDAREWRRIRIEYVSPIRSAKPER